MSKSKPNNQTRHVMSSREAAKIFTLASSAALGGLLLTQLFHGTEASAPKPASLKPKSVGELKTQFAGIGIDTKKVHVTRDATGVALVERVNHLKEENGVYVRDAKTSMRMHASAIQLSEEALQRLAQIPAGEGSGQDSIVGPDGVQEHDIQFSANQYAKTDTVEVPVITTQAQAKALDGVLPPPAHK